MGLKQKIAIGTILAGALAGLCTGCNSQTPYEKWRGNLTPEQLEKHKKDCRKASFELMQYELRKDEQNRKASLELARYNAQKQQQGNPPNNYQKGAEEALIRGAGDFIGDSFTGIETYLF